ncbi:MAG TPA: SDR family oxidoreductase, partial [Polyangiales bacterium]
MPNDTPTIEECVRWLEALVEDRARLSELDQETRNRLLMAAGRLSRPERDEQRVLARAMRKKNKRERRAADEALLDRTGIRRQRLLPVFVAPDPVTRLESEGFREASAEQTLQDVRVCYVCKAPRDKLHHFYDQLCESCGDFNYAKRSQTADLSGRVALISGARVKIGYRAALMLLRAGARVIVSTRFPRDAALRYAREPDFEQFADRLQIYGLDLRHTPSVEAFARQLRETERRLDFVLHNACQTVRRPSGFYQHLMEGELAPLDALPDRVHGLLREYETARLGSHPLQRPRSDALAVGLHAAPVLSQVALTHEDLDASTRLFPSGQLDADLQQVDLRAINSWRLALDQVGTVELLEVQLVNAIAPFVLNARLKPLMLRDKTGDKHIVNVSAMEGQFYRRFKTDKHPHTNMAKAALNMMTRTSAPDYARDGIHMN